ncbi:hypothetical protein CB0940_10896 [Cercospora beticola]|uniref:Uncharacterized protein n=1 Tax=Cercospora beticola TaxID=122368 RepID=A0A2G5HE80_CERBT|nr:hypothetical protein CB0940_10896 [Cercospora beticola]XP_023450367.1 hypothetical protein CB0940_10896 [Cercospora beticola]PIA90805.1 hypothetical protein CB0940_10896 [Cercospora beticola]PIA90806.1 hypothetical protein CB0940_10896 [Cercospora beticola]WPB07767.1 hypothetical protein RHO25_012431 [Cercospora beticola]
MMPAAEPACSSIFVNSRKRSIAGASWQDMPFWNEYTISARCRACGLRSQLPIRFAHCTQWVCGFDVQQPITKRTLSFPAAVVSLSLLHMNMHLVANAYIYDHIGLAEDSLRLYFDSESC